MTTPRLFLRAGSVLLCVLQAQILRGFRALEYWPKDVLAALAVTSFVSPIRDIEPIGESLADGERLMGLNTNPCGISAGQTLERASLRTAMAARAAG